MEIKGSPCILLYFLHPILVYYPFEKSFYWVLVHLHWSLLLCIIHLKYMDAKLLLFLKCLWQFIVSLLGWSHSTRSKATEIQSTYMFAQMREKIWFCCKWIPVKKKTHFMRRNNFRIMLNKAMCFLFFFLFCGWGRITGLFPTYCDTL